MKKLCQYISQYMGVLVLVSAVAALVFPDVFSVWHNISGAIVARIYNHL